MLRDIWLSDVSVYSTAIILIVLLSLVMLDWWIDEKNIDVQEGDDESENK